MYIVHDNEIYTVVRRGDRGYGVREMKNIRTGIVTDNGQERYFSKHNIFDDIVLARLCLFNEISERCDDLETELNDLAQRIAYWINK